MRSKQPAQLYPAVLLTVSPKWSHHCSLHVSPISSPSLSQLHLMFSEHPQAGFCLRPSVLSVPTVWESHSLYILCLAPSLHSGLCSHNIFQWALYLLPHLKSGYSSHEHPLTPHPCYITSKAPTTIQHTLSFIILFILCSASLHWNTSYMTEHFYCCSRPYPQGLAHNRSHNGPDR